ncbi:hypothetical protein C7447_10310 [Tenacibaculum adriaticum]|uniref:Uncharacterized protein n=1 Tax=Tenacibaculum adriaticum TaxID=413713 RepID=A0A5S5DQ45_9FLAO|nr:hypothetical protein [Tenacibaculum adriaticum]TYP97845.1 hypothetical protein C7447_10310 [Tenacibaculum adriaticum]
MKLSKTLFGQTVETLGWLLIIIFLGLFLDSDFFSKNYFEHGQWLNNVLVIAVYLYFFKTGTRRVREQLIYALIIGVIGEYLFSLVLRMYTYRLHNIPHYIPFGHAVVFLGIYIFSRKSKVRAYSKQIELFITICIVIYSLLFLVFKKDVFGFVLTLLVFYSLRKHPKERLFYLSMYFIVAVVEIVGTSLDCWVWPSTAYGKFDFLPSANPPSGISFFYFGLDRGTMSIYKRRHKEVWKRFKNIRQLTITN